MKLVSIIIPTYNSEKFLDRTISGVLNQSYQNWELIIVDDCSKDGTVDIINNWKEKDSRIKLIVLKSNSGGPAHPKNIGLQEARGKYIAFLDHDDEWLPEKLEKQVAFLENGYNAKFGLVTCNAFICINKKRYNYVTPIYEADDQLINLLRDNFVLSCSSILVNKEIFYQVGDFDEYLKCFDDWDLYIMMVKKNYYIGVTPENLFIWHPQKMGIEKRLNSFEKIREVEYILDKHKESYLFDQASYAKNLRSLGVLYCISGEFKKGRDYIEKALGLSYQIFFTYLLFFLSFLKSRYIFKTLLYIRKRIGGAPLDQI